MNTTSSNNGGTLLEVSFPPQLSGASPTTYFYGNMIWRQFVQSKANTAVKQVKSSEERMQLVTVPSSNKQEYSQLHISACLGQMKATNSYLENCSVYDVNKRDHNGNSPLHWAASEGNDEVVQLLVDSRADVNMQNFAGETPLFIAASRGLDSTVALLCELGANPNIPNIDGASPLHMASASGFGNTVMLLLSKGAFANAQDDAGDSPLHYAVREERLDIVELLVTRCNACVDIKNDDYETPLQLASCLESTELVQFLSKFGKHEGNSDAMFLVQGNFDW